ncbi:ABC transporter permease [Confluentibacter sediminis]|uniref:ABC transporter permease n=1 Tax=Confluentibacter sediminis TaxID=2219045 RepID=UPI000DAF0306|nr:ABC transporter permease [Confluentibacter sediminis]
MFKNYFKIAFRNLWRHRLFSFLNILGLTVGMTACFLIFTYVNFETSYDNFHSKSDRIYRIVADLKTPTEVINGSGPSWAVAPHITEFPEVETAIRVMQNVILFKKGNVKFNEPEALFADPDFFTTFDFPLVKGDSKTVLTEPLSIVLSETLAKKYFGDEEPMGKTILLTGDQLPATVTGIMKDFPENSQIKGNVVVSMTTITKKFNARLNDQWANYSPYAYVLLKPGTDAIAFEKKLPGFLEKWNGKEMDQLQMYPTLFLEPMKDVYLRSTRGGFVTGNIKNVYIFSIIGFFIICIASINFINLTTARSAERAKEVGIRKVIGARKTQLVLQFIGESIIICMIAFILTIGLIALLNNSFNDLSGKVVSTGIFNNLQYVFYLLLVALGIGLLAGIYPAFILSSFKPVTVLKGRFATGANGNLLRKSLVVSQFAISTALVIGTIVVYAQMSFMRNQDLGFKKDQVLVIETNGDSGAKALKETLKGLANVNQVSLSGSVPATGNPSAYSEIENIKGELQKANLDLFFVDFDYIPLYKMEVVAGRAFSRDFMTDTTQAMVLNEAAVKMFGYTSSEQAIGKEFKQWGREGKIVGVIKDFHFQSLQQPIKPLTMRIEQGNMDYLSVSLNTSNLQSTLATIEKAYQKNIPNRPYSYYFLDEFFDRQYKSEEKFGTLFLNFSLLAIFISCLGLLGLASYSTMQRTKEIGVRKVLGASVPNILNLLSKDFLKLVAMSFLVAVPVSAYFMHKWLNDFAYRINLSWWVFALAMLIALTVAFLTIMFQTLKAATTNPTKSLRTE